MVIRSSVRGWGIVAVCVVAAFGVDFKAALSRPDRDPIPVHIEIVSSERARPTLVVPGVVEAKSTRSLGFRASGQIARFHVEQDARVAAGEVIAEFDLDQLEAEQRSARTNLVRAQARRLEAAVRESRRRRLLEWAAAKSAPVESPSVESLLYEAELRYAQASIERSRSRLAAGVLRAPANGVVDRRYRDVGEIVLAGTPVVRLTELDVLATRASLPRALRTLLRVGGRAAVRVEGQAAAAVPAEIVSVGGEASAATGEVEFELRVGNPELVLRPGMLVAASIAVDGPDTRYTIPLTAVRRGIDAQPFSFVVVGSGSELRVERRRLVFGGFDGDRVAVVSGLAVGDRVVTHGQDLVTVGDRVRIVGEEL